MLDIVNQEKNRTKYNLLKKLNDMNVSSIRLTQSHAETTTEF